VTASTLIRRPMFLTVIGIAIATIAAPAAADPADDLVNAMGYGDYYTSFSAVMVEQAVEKLQKLQISPEVIAADRPKIEADAAAYRPTFLGSIAKAYRARFTPSELQELAKFYQSPLGQKIGQAQKPIKDEMAAASTAGGMFIALQTAQLVKK